MSAPFVHLHVHSAFSFARGADSLERLCDAARERGMDALAVTDRNGLYGLVWFLGFARAAGIRPIVGAEAAWGPHHAVVLVRTAEGYVGLCRMLTRLHAAAGPVVGSEGPEGNGTFSLPDELARLDGVVVLSPDRVVLAAVQEGRGTADLYAEVHPALGTRERAALKSFLKARGIPPVATGAVHFADPQRHTVHRLLRAIATNGVLPADGEPENPGTVPKDCWLVPAARAAARVPDLPGAVENAALVADRCRYIPDLGRPIFPDYPVDGGGDPADLLEARCRAGIAKRYGEATDDVERRLRHELQVIREKGFAPYFLVVHDIVSGAPRTCGRGSAAASLVSYLLGITNVDPVRHDLYFERFLNPGRRDPPDIDVDFPWDERDSVLEATFERFGRDDTAMIANHVTFGPRAAVRETAKVYGLPDGEIGRVSKRIPWHADDPADAVATHPAFRGLDLRPPWPEILERARTIHGAPRGLSVHPGGVVIVPGGVDRVVPVQPAPKGVRIIQWEKDQAEDAGLVKIDLLGNRSLAVIRDACREAAAHGEDIPDPARFDPTEDPKTQDLIRRGDTMGVFYVESPAMRQLQARCGKGDFAHLVIHSSIIRPAANEYVREYVRRLKGGGWEPLHPLLTEVLDESYGVMVYQEHVAKTAIALAGFDDVSADDLRKILSKKNKATKLADLGKKFVLGARERGVPDDIIGKVWDQILSFGGYSFCKPHSASYAIVSFQSAWLRAHHPAEFVAAVISNQGGYYATFAYVSEGKRMGLTILPPCVNRSEKAWTGRGKEVRVGLMQIVGIPDAFRDALRDERRKRGPYTSLADLLDRVEAATPDATRTLILSGACDVLIPPGGSRADLVWELAARRGHSVFSSNLFGGEAPEAKALPRMGDYDARTLLKHEVETLGFLVSRHPLTLHAAAIRRAGAIPGRDLGKHVGHRVKVAGWYVTGKPVLTKKGEPMEFFSFEDTTALYETTFFPRTYARFIARISRTRPYLLTGRVEEEQGVVTLTVDEVEFLDR